MRPGEVRATAGAADDDVGRLAGHPHLLDRLLADDGLMEEHVVEDRAEGVLRVVAGRRVLDRLADRHPERAGAVRRLGEDLAAVGRVLARAGNDLRAVGFHEDPPVRLLVVAGPDHVDLDLEAEERAGEGQGAPHWPAPVSVARRVTPCLLVVVTPARAPCSACGCRTGCRPRTCSRCGRAYRAPSPGDGPGRAGWGDRGGRRRGPAPGISISRSAETSWPMSAIGKQRRQVVRPDRLAGAGMERRRRRHRQVGRDVVPGARNARLIEDELRLSRI